MLTAPRAPPSKRSRIVAVSSLEMTRLTLEIVGKTLETDAVVLALGQDADSDFLYTTLLPSSISAFA